MLPTKIRVAGIDYTIAEKEFVEVYQDKNFIGSCDRDHAKIEIVANMAPQRKVQTLLHELTHAILYECGYWEQDEILVDNIARTLYQVLKDNDMSFIWVND